MDNTTPLESKTENKYVSFVDKLGYDALKINKVGWPDRLTVLNNGYSFYIEFKRNTKTFGKRQGEKYQNYIHKKLRAKGTHVYLVDTFLEAKEIFEYELIISTQISKLMYMPKEFRK